MSKMSQIAADIAELKHCGEVLVRIAESLNEVFLDADEKPKTQESNETKRLSLEEVRAVLAAKSRDGHTQEVKELLTEFGVQKLSDLEPEKYEDLLKKAEVI